MHNALGSILSTKNNSNNDSVCPGPLPSQFSQRLRGWARGHGILPLNCHTHSEPRKFYMCPTCPHLLLGMLSLPGPCRVHCSMWYLMSSFTQLNHAWSIEGNRIYRLAGDIGQVAQHRRWARPAVYYLGKLKSWGSQQWESGNQSWKNSLREDQGSCSTLGAIPGWSQIQTITVGK
jgi:hypothetical protein